MFFLMNSFDKIMEDDKSKLTDSSGDISFPGNMEETASSASCDKDFTDDQETGFIFEESDRGKLFISDILY